jgi:hypothetical protein
MKHWTMKVNGGVELQLCTFLILALGRQKLSATAPLPWVDETPVPLNKRLDGPQNSSGQFGEWVYLLPLLRNLHTSIIQPVS